MQAHMSQNMHVDEHGQQLKPEPGSAVDKESQLAPITRSSTLRPRTSGSTSALPKYRPRSIVLDPSKDTSKRPASPVRGGRRRAHSSSDDESSISTTSQTTQSADTNMREKASRPISPLPQRRANKARALPQPSKISKPSTPTTPTTPRTASPARRTKSVKTSSTSSASQNAIRPPSSTSSSSSFTPRTPQSPSKSSLAKTATRDKSSPSPSPMRKAATESPLRKTANPSRTALPTVFVADMSHISETNDEDSEEDDVADMLAPIADLTAPTPAIPRFNVTQTRNRHRLNPQTPTRANLLPSRSQLSYVSPLPPEKNSASSLRPVMKGMDGKMARGSILTWEELATDASRTLGEEEIGTLLSDIPAPFQPGVGPASPTPSNMSLQDVPESPCLSAMPSPGGYGSISQVLLPEFTPSPAPHANLSHRFDVNSSESADSATVTLLRLQLASVENTARERLQRLQVLEEEMYSLKLQRASENQELANAAHQMSYLEETVITQMQERAEKEREAYAESLEAELQMAESRHQQVLTDAVAHTRRDVEKYYSSQAGTVRKAGVAQSAAAQWACVRTLAQSEIEDIQNNTNLLSFLLGELAIMHQFLSCS
jgi:rubrerythrin